MELATVFGGVMSEMT